MKKLKQQNRMQFYITEQYACSYIQGLNARSQVASPSHLINFDAYNVLVEDGFRRSGVFSYKPHCDKCQSCIPIRIPVKSFTPNKTQKRTKKKLFSMLCPKEEELAFQDEHYLLYKNYQLKRHPNSGMCEDSEEQYKQFLLTSNVKTELFTFRNGNGELKMVCIFDVLKNGLSSVYTFFSTDSSSFSFGTYGILWQIEECKKRGYDFLYLGYWINQSPKMSYKTKFKPFEILDQGQWISGK